MTYIALLRGINVGGHNKIAMSDLQQLFGALGFADPKSLLQSGNVVFKSKQKSGDALERLLEAETAKRLGVSIDYIVRTADQWRVIIIANPFPKEAERDPAHLVVMCFKKELQQNDLPALQTAIKGPEYFRADGKQLYVVYPKGIGQSKLTNSLIERKLGQRGTARNWNTVLKLGEWSAGDSG